MRFNSRTMISCLAILLAACSEETVDSYASGTLEGKVVVKGSNEPVEHVKITTNPSSNTVFTNEAGEFSIPKLDAGDYSVQADHESFQTTFEPAKIVADQLTNVIVEMDSVQSGNLSPLKPLGLFPEDQAEEVGNNVQFLWSSSQNDQDEVTYSVELRNGSTNESLVYNGIRDTTLLVENLQIGTVYFWQLTASDGVNAQVEGNLSSFQVRGVGSNRFLFVRKVGDNNVIFSGAEPSTAAVQEADQNVVQLTNSQNNSYRPKLNAGVDKIAYLGVAGSETHLFVMDKNGGNKQQVTGAIPVAGFAQGELEFAWSNNGKTLYYPNFNRLYAINIDRSGNTMVYEAPANEFITELAVNPSNGNLALKTNNAQGYGAKIYTITSGGMVQQTVADGMSGALGGLDFSVDGKKLLFTRDVSGAENAQYRQLDSRIFEYDLAADTTTEFVTEKPIGQNDLDPKYAPDGGYIIYTRTSNDGVSQRVVQRTQIRTDDSVVTDVLFTNASMANWE